MAIPFESIPQNLRVPFVYVEITAAAGGVAGAEFRTALIGQRLSTGQVAEAVPTLIGNAVDAATAFGRGSQLALMCAAFRRSDPIGELWAVALDDASTATHAENAITVTGPATGAGSVSLYVGGRRIEVGVASGDTAAEVAAAIVAGVNDDDDLPVTAAVAGAVATLTARNGGVAQDLNVQANFQPDEALPASVTLAFAPAAGTVDPDIADAIAALGDRQYNLIVSPYTDATNMTALEGELALRWGPTQQNDGQGIVAYRGTLSATTGFGNGRASRHMTIMGHNDIPNATWEFAAAVAGTIAPSVSADPARPFQTLAVQGMLAPQVQNRWDFTERNVILSDGVSTFNTVGDQVRIERLVTSDQTDANYYDLNAILTLSYLRRDFRNRILTRFPRYKLADDGARFQAGQAVITPAIGRSEALAWFSEQEASGLVEGFDAFRDALVVERPSTDRNRLDWQLQPDLINQFRIAGVQIAFLT